MKKFKKVIVSLLVVCMLGFSLPALATDTQYNPRNNKGDSENNPVVGISLLVIFIGVSSYYLHKNLKEQKNEKNKTKNQEAE